MKTFIYQVFLPAWISLTAAALCIVTSVSAQPVADSVSEMITSGSAYISGRYRYEIVDQNGFSENAAGSTIRTRIGLKSAEFSGLSVHLEIEDVSPAGSDDYNSTINGNTSFPVVADPNSTEINLANIKYVGLPDTALTFGRQGVALDDQRFIGTVDWRQNNQTYDAFTLANTSIPDLTAVYGYVFGINRILSRSHPMGDLNTNAHLFNASYKGLPVGKITGFAYLLDVENAAAVSSATYGARFDGRFNISEDFKALYDFYYAQQSDYADNPATFDVDFFRAEGGLKISDFIVKAGVESLGSDNGDVGFSMPASTAHKFNGFADLFLSTPATGLEDLYAKLIFKPSTGDGFFSNSNWLLSYHDFSATEGNMDYGTEVNFNFAKKFMDNFMAGLKYADYSSDGFGVDTEKLIFTFGFSFTQ